MLPVTLSKKGNARWRTIHYGINGWKLQPMIIPKCARCTGIFIFWEAVFSDCTVYSITGAHLPPAHKKDTRAIHREFFKGMQKDIPGGKPYYAIVCGGKIDTPQNKWWYYFSRRRYVEYLSNMYPDLEISIYTPDKDTAAMTMKLDEHGEVDADYFIRTA
jgi:hypothetical protein